MLACSFCSNVMAPSWWSTGMPFVVGIAVTVGLFVLLAMARDKGSRRVGGLLIAAGLVLALPLAAVVAERSDTQVEVVGTRPPADAPAWRVRCSTVFQQTEFTDGNNADFNAACSDATRPRRFTSYGLALLAAALTAVGVAIAVTGRPGQPVHEVA